MCLLLKKAGIPYRAANMDTGWEHASTYQYLVDIQKVIGPIEFLKSDAFEGLVDLIRKKGMFPSRVIRFCTLELKIKPFEKFLKGLDDEPVNAVGIRAQESRSRSTMPEWEWNDRLDCEVWRPLIDWSYEDVIKLHQDEGVTPNPLYLDASAERVGCWPCIFAQKTEIRSVADLDPERIELIAALEVELWDAYAARCEARGEEPDEESRPTFFHKRSNMVVRGETRPWPIHEAVAWAKTEHGGQQLSMFSPDYARDGCMRWGMCGS